MAAGGRPVELTALRPESQPGGPTKPWHGGPGSRGLAACPGQLGAEGLEPGPGKDHHSPGAHERGRAALGMAGGNRVCALVSAAAPGGSPGCCFSGASGDKQEPRWLLAPGSPEPPVPRPACARRHTCSAASSAPRGALKQKHHPPPWESPSCKSPGAGEHLGEAPPPPPAPAAPRTGSWLCSTRTRTWPIPSTLGRGPLRPYPAPGAGPEPVPSPALLQPQGSPALPDAPAPARLSPAHGSAPAVPTAAASMAPRVQGAPHSLFM